MNALATINDLPLTKMEQEDYSRQAIEEILSGNVDPVLIDMKLKALEEVIKKIRSDNRVKSYTVEEAEKYGKSHEKHGVKITVTARTTKDYTGCGDEVYNQMFTDLDVLKKNIKARELLIDSGVDMQTGATFGPPRTETTVFLTYKF